MLLPSGRAGGWAGSQFMATVTISPKFQVVSRKDVRRRFGLTPRHKIQTIVVEDKVGIVTIVAEERSSAEPDHRLVFQKDGNDLDRPLEALQSCTGTLVRNRRPENFRIFLPSGNKRRACCPFRQQGRVSRRFSATPRAGPSDEWEFDLSCGLLSVCTCHSLGRSTSVEQLIAVLIVMLRGSSLNRSADTSSCLELPGGYRRQL
jgi:hypothetical protein